MTASGPSLDRASLIRRNDSVLSTEVDGEMVMMDVEQGVYFGLDAIGTDIWHRLATPATPADLAEALAGDYEAEVETIERDLLALLAQMAERGLISVAP